MRTLLHWCAGGGPRLRRRQAQAAKHVSVAVLSVTGGRMLLRLKPKKAVPELARGHLTS